MENYLSLIIQIISIIAGLWGIWYFLLIPKLRYKIDIIPVVRPTIPLNNLKILFTDKQVSELSIGCISIYNKGLGVADNFTTPITIYSNRKILEIQLDEESFNSKIINKQSISKDGKSVELDINFINNNDNIKYYFIIEGTDDIEISVSGRCKGCSKIKHAFTINRKYINKYLPWFFTALFLISIAIGTSLLKNKIHTIHINLKNINQNISQQLSEIKK